MDGGAWWAVVHGVTKSRTRLSDFPFTFHFHALEKEMAPHSSVLAWRIPGTRELGGLPSMGSHRVGHDWSDLATAAAAASLLKGLTKFFEVWLLSVFECHFSVLFCLCMPGCCLFSRVWLCATLWTVPCQAPPSMGFSSQEYWSGLPCLLQGIVQTQGSNPCLIHLLHWLSGSLPLASHGKPLLLLYLGKLIRKLKHSFLWLWQDVETTCR